VVTDLMARTMPMLRYETGDRGALAIERCHCHRTFPRLVGLVGRAADVVLLPDGRRLHWPYFHETFARFDDLERYQVVQDDPHRLRIRVLTGSEHWDALVALLRAQLATHLPATMTLVFEPWGSEPDDPTRKYRPVLSRLDGL
jgi:phenylacetate-CoA ligase